MATFLTRREMALAADWGTVALASAGEGMKRWGGEKYNYVL
jgi:hypothetical protein